MEVNLMGLEINLNQLPINGMQSSMVNPIRSQCVDPRYTLGLTADYLSRNSDLARYLNEKAILEMISVNSEIVRILKGLKIRLRINMKILNDLVDNHLPQTKKTALGIVNNLPKEFKSAVDLQALQKATVLHDIGKVLIPENILNKAGALNDEELEIMQKHSVLGYEMLKTTDLDKKTLELIKNHHQNAQKTGYPKVEEDFVSDITSQILSTADMYSALSEKRPYKEAFSKNKTLAIIHGYMKQDKIHPYVFKALVDYANAEEEKSVKLKPQRQVPNLKFVNSLSA